MLKKPNGDLTAWGHIAQCIPGVLIIVVLSVINPWIVVALAILMCAFNTVAPR
ncbi:MAG TPA: hypothetical protein VNY05_30160 [Candidatus Acidoferrales bacterium]|jgi:hypothetical protein|nr:hypothetical protein [Candidatus Acidoferrales bacterium]